MGCTMFGQTDNPNRIWRSTACGCVGLAEAQQAHTHSVHTHTVHNCGSVPAGGQSLPSSYTFILSLFPSVLSSPPFLPLDLSFLLHPSFLLVSKNVLLLFKGRRKESVKDTKKLAKSNGRKGQNHHRGQLWLGLCVYVRFLFGFGS